MRDRERRASFILHHRETWMIQFLRRHFYIKFNVIILTALSAFRGSFQGVKNEFSLPLPLFLLESPSPVLIYGGPPVPTQSVPHGTSSLSHIDPEKRKEKRIQKFIILLALIREDTELLAR